MPVSGRVILYVACSTFACFLAFNVGEARSQRACEADIEATDCDVAVVDGFLWALLALGLCIVVATVLELVRAWREARSDAATRPPASQ